MISFLTVVYVLVCMFLILVVLLQAGRGGGMGTAFGGSSQTVFGGAGAGNFLTRLTVVMAAAFMLLSATLAFLSSSSEKALDRAALAIKTREEARKLTPDAKKAQTPDAKGEKLLSTSVQDAGEAVAPEAAPQAPVVVEGAPTGAAQGALQAVDDALAPNAAAPAADKPAGAKPARAAMKPSKPAAAPAAPSEPAEVPPTAPAPAAPTPAPAAPAAP